MCIRSLHKNACVSLHGLWPTIYTQWIHLITIYTQLFYIKCVCFSLQINYSNVRIWIDSKISGLRPLAHPTLQSGQFWHRCPVHLADQSPHVYFFTQKSPWAFPLLDPSLLRGDLWPVPTPRCGIRHQHLLSYSAPRCTLIRTLYNSTLRWHVYCWCRN